MKYVEVVAASGSAETVRAIAEKVNAHDFRLGMPDETNQQTMRLLVSDERMQSTLDALQNVLGAQPSARITVLQVESYLPRVKDSGRKQKGDRAGASRESLYEQIAKGANLDFNFLLLVLLSTVVAAIGLLENNVAVVIGAMVIAPLLSPNLALSLGTALGDLPLVRRSIVTLCAGIGLAMLLSALIGLTWDGPVNSPELLSRTSAGWDSVALALASGAAAAMSLTSGLSSVLVGVMVAVALLPPAASAGIMLGTGEPLLALGASLLLAINIVCVNLASKIVFYARDIRPRTWVEKEKARSAVIVVMIGWLVALSLLIVATYAHRTLST